MPRSARIFSTRLREKKIGIMRISAQQHRVIFPGGHMAQAVHLMTNNQFCIRKYDDGKKPLDDSKFCVKL